MEPLQSLQLLILPNGAAIYLTKQEVLEVLNNCEQLLHKTAFNMENTDERRNDETHA